MQTAGVARGTTTSTTTTNGAGAENDTGTGGSSSNTHNNGNNGNDNGNGNGISSHAAATSVHANKRRRRDADPVATGADENAPSIADAYDQTWDKDAHAQPSQLSHSRPFGSGGAGGTHFSSNAHPDYGAAGATVQGSDMPAPETSSWHQQQHSDTAAYPDLATYHAQPYFYPHSTPSNYNSSWQPAAPACTAATATAAAAAAAVAVAASSQTYGDAATASGYAVDDQQQAGTTAMPYFPQQQQRQAQSGNGDEAGGNRNGDAASSYSSFAELELANQYAPYSQPSHTATLAQREAAKSSAYYFDDAGMHLKIQSLPILDNLATQLIAKISKSSYSQIQDMMQDASDSEDSQAYKTVKSLFDQTRKVYSRETPFIDAIAIQMFQPNQQEIIRKANIATFISSILGAHDVSFFHLNEFFMETFVPLGHRLLKWQGAIYLELKTQIYISALMNSDGSPEAMLDELFPLDLDAQILTRHPDAPSLSPSEQDFIDRSRARKSYLLAEPSTQEALRELPKKYQWADFVREFASCITKNVDGIMNVPIRSQSGGAGGASFGRAGASHDSGANGTNAAGGAQSQANNGKSGSNAQSSEPRKQASPASRQPWTKPEEDALIAGLDRVNGPHWSQILALYGRGGSVSEVLKDRNQVQLKDKARNLKLQYLKTGKEVPPALRGVTGELRKRGGARARAALGLAGDDEQSAVIGGGGGVGADTEEADGDASTDMQPAKARPRKKTSKR